MGYSARGKPRFPPRTPSYSGVECGVGGGTHTAKPALSWHASLSPRTVGLRTLGQFRIATGWVGCCRAVDESQEQWEDLHGPQAVIARLAAIETRLEELRAEVAVVGQWADHPASPDIRVPLRQVRELLRDAARQVRHARQQRK